ncbi:MAG: phospholipid N-methyltransferase PmtA [Pararhizobium sp.]
MRQALHKRIVRKFDDEIRFFKGWIDGPKQVGAIVPTSPITARRMASVIDAASGRPVLELGPGTGAVTKAILDQGIAPERLYSIEYSHDFFTRLVEDYPSVRFIHGDAFDLNAALGDDRGLVFDSIISAIPLLSFPMERRVALVDSLLDRVPAGRPVVQISYGAVSPVAPKRAAFAVEPLDWVVRNIPPARLWVYRRPRAA